MKYRDYEGICSKVTPLLGHKEAGVRNQAEQILSKTRKVYDKDIAARKRVVKTKQRGKTNGK